MRIVKGETENFEDYVVIRPEKFERVEFLGEPMTGPMRFEVGHHAQIYRNVIEADDETGLLVEHLADWAGNLLYTNGSEDIVIDNTVRALMLNPQLRAEFVAAGFRPKVNSTYVAGIRIIRRT